MEETETSENQSVEEVDELSLFNKTFATFNDTIRSLNRSYASLQARYQKLADELSETNEKLRQALEENVRTRNFLENVLESLTSGVITIDLEGRISTINRAGCQILRSNYQDIVGSRYSRLFGSSFARNHPLPDLLNSGKPYRNVEKNIAVSNSESVPISVCSDLITDAAGETIGALEVFVDLTEMKRLEGEIARVKSLAALGEVAAVIAHEVRNPLSGIGGFAALLKGELGEDHPQIEYLNKITAGVEKLDRGVSSLLEYARDLRVELETGDLRDLLRETVEFFQIDLSAKESQSRIELSLPDKPVNCRFDREHLSRALINLFQNAEQAMPAGGTIRVTLAAKGENITITIEDEGESIPEEIREKVFAPFFTTREGGTGLGLALVKKIVAAHQGTIEMVTGHTKGSAFIISFQKIL
ncbi:MAG: PAS domain-containing protein [candidate division Zixibacteria bacterium]|nr:PAS domain-containing protein [candidate division Zixibacteria bacterium]